MTDLRFAFRHLAKNPGFAAIAVTTLALGIGVAAAMFGLIQGALLSPPPYENPERLVLVTPARADGGLVERGGTTGLWMAWRNAASVETAAAYGWTFNFLVRTDGSESLGGMAISRDYFRTLGIHPIRGRGFSATDIPAEGSPPATVVLGYDLWQRRFGGRADVIGTAIRISRQPNPLTVIGVTPPGVRFLPDPGAASEPNYDVNAKVDFWLPAAPDESQPNRGEWNVVARVRPGATVEQAQDEMAAASASQAQRDPDLVGITARVMPVLDVLNRAGRSLLMPLFGAVLLVFLIACANVAGLLLSRGLQRQHEYAMRGALGASRWRLFRQVLVESAAIAVVGAVLGAAIAVSLIVILRTLGESAIPRADAIAIGWPVFAFGAAAAFAAALAAGLIPAIRASGQDRLRVTGGRTTTGRADRRLLAGAAILQIVLTVALLAGAGLLVRTARQLEAVQPGYDTAHVLAMTVTAMDRHRWTDFHTRALASVTSLPGVTHAAFAWGVPLTGNKWPGEIELPSAPAATRLGERIHVPLRSITPDYFAVVGMRLLDGRAFSASDTDTAPPVAIVNQAFVHRHLSDRAPLGQAIRFPGGRGQPLTIVGVVADTRTESLSEAPQPEVYLPFWQSGAFSKHLVLRVSGDPTAVTGAVRRELRAIDPTAAVEHVTTLAAIRRESLASWIFAMRLLSGFAVAASFLALVGLYGLLSLSVTARVREIGVRKAIGAQGSQIVGLVVREASRVIAAGVALGLVAAVALGRVLSALLFDVTPADPRVLAGSATLFAAIGLAVCLVPAVRARGVNVMEALRQE
jgi:putative ABC transport system permease protein